MSGVDSYAVNPEALKPLMRTYWSAEGWREPPAPPVGGELDRAVQDGVMFAGPVQRDHDGWIHAARRAADAIALDEVADAFISSLASRRLDLRSALGSYAVARHVPEHAFESGVSQGLCRVCGLPAGEDPEDLNVLNFERFKWGGVRHDDLRYVAFDLEQFLRAPKDRSGEAGIVVGRQVLETLREVPARETATGAVSRLRMVKGNAEERATLLDILGVCGVLATSDHPGYLSEFVLHDERALPPHHFVERSYPVCWWRGSDGVNEAAVRTFLPALQ